MKTKTNSALIEVKAIGDSDDGKFQAYASVFDNVDSYGDMVIKGAFAESLADFGTKGDGIPLYWRHRMDDPFMNLGVTTEAKEDDHGLWVECQIDLDTAAGKQTHKLLKQGRVAQMSFAYDIVEAAWVERKAEEGGSYYELRKLRIHEVSIVPIGANQETEILVVKSALDAVATDVKAGRAITGDNREELLGVAKSIVALLGEKDQEEADAPSDAKTEEPSGAKAEEPTTVPSARALAQATIEGLR